MTKKVTFDDYEFRRNLTKIIGDNCEDVPYEGTEVDVEGIITDIMSLISSKTYSLLNHTKKQENGE